jgi:predicted transposase/invertase (TIGR01784 family)
LELPKLPKEPEQAGDSSLWSWAALFATRGEEELNMLAERSPEIGRAVGLLKELSADEAIRMQYEAHEKALRDDKARIRRARSEGIEIGRREGNAIGRDKEKREIAKNCLAWR